MKFIIDIIAILLIICLSSTLALNREWWKHATIYEVWLKSFKDSDGDGIGDLKGVTSKLDYFVDIGVDTVWISPFHPSPNADGGYDVVDYYKIDPIYGTIADFEELMNEMKKRGLNFVMDLVFNHCSDENEWFQKSIKRIEPYTDYFIWADPKGYDYNGKPIPPNRWPSVFNATIPGSTWTWNDQRNQFYFHQFYPKQPDFNLRNENVKKELKAIMKFWLDKGVTAFRMDALPHFMEDPHLTDEYYGAAFIGVLTGHSDGESVRLNHPDTFKLLNEIYLFLRNYDRKNKKERETAMMLEAYVHMNGIMKYYGTKKMPASHFPFNYQITNLHHYLDAKQMLDYLNDWLLRVPEGATSNWALGNHDEGRTFYRFSKEYNYVLFTIVTMLPGATSFLYGEELSQEVFDFTPEKVKDFFIDRDHFRLPMQWDDSLNAGFSSGDKTWLPVSPAYWHSNVKAQMNQPTSTLNYSRDLLFLRKTDTFKYGDLKLYAISKWILAFTRIYRETKYVIVLNLGTENCLVDLHSTIDDLPSHLTVKAASPNSGYSKGETFQTILNHRSTNVLRPHSTVVLSNLPNENTNHQIANRCNS